MGYTGHLAQKEAVNMIKHADKNNDGGHIDSKELAQILFPEQYDENIADEEEERKLNQLQNEDNLNNEQFLEVIQKMISEVDKNGDGKIDFEEFKKAMKEDMDKGRSLFGGDQNEDDAKYGGLIGPKIVE